MERTLANLTGGTLTQKLVTFKYTTDITGHFSAQD